MTSTRATSFGAWAEQYDDHRPTYPDDAVAWLVPTHATRVAEVGAGTGKLTERLVAEACEAAGARGVPLAHDAVCIRWSPDGGGA